MKSLKKNCQAKKIYSSLTGRKITGKEYEHAFHFWNKYEVKTIKDYPDLYLKCEILLIVNVFEKFKNSSLKTFGLCPGHYSSTPG